MCSRRIQENFGGPQEEETRCRCGKEAAYHLHSLDPKSKTRKRQVRVQSNGVEHPETTELPRSASSYIITGFLFL